MMKVSIIIRAYNAEDTIERALQSVFAQDIPRDDYEVIVVNDGSRDETANILEKQKGHKNFHIMHQENQGGTAAANNGLEKSRGSYVILLDDDDYFLPSCARELSSYLDAHENADFAYSDYYEECKGARRLISPRHIFETLDGGTMFRRKKLLEQGGWSEGILFAGYDLFLRTFHQWKGGHIKKPLFIYTRNKESNTAKPEFVRKGIKQLQNRFPDKLDIINTIRSYEIN